MAILFFILRLIGWVLLAILLLLVVALLLPLGIQAAYRPGEAFPKAFYGPLKFTLWPRGGTQGAQSKAKSKPTQICTSGTEGLDSTGQQGCSAVRHF